MKEEQENKEESKTEDKTQKPTTSSNIKTGTYKVNAAVRVRVAPGTGNEVAKVEDMPKTIQYIVYANSSVIYTGVIAFIIFILLPLYLLANFLFLVHK